MVGRGHSLEINFWRVQMHERRQVHVLEEWGQIKMCKDVVVSHHVS